MNFARRRDLVRSGGWFNRAQSVLAGISQDCVEQGYLLLPVAFQRMAQGNAAAALTVFERAASIGEHFGDPDLLALGRLGAGRALIREARVAEAMPRLDEVMIAVEAHEVSPIVAGIVYCAVIDACNDVSDLRRARQWTAALSRWCTSQPDLVPFRGQCLVHRAEILRWQGAWPEAMNEVLRAGKWLTDQSERDALAAAHYQQGELYRLQGQFAAAEDAYREASRAGREPQPGLALLRLAQNQIGAAEGAIRRTMSEADDTMTRSALLPAFVEIMLAAGDLPAARDAAGELSTISDARDVPLLYAVSMHVMGAVRLAEGDAGGALAALRRAWTGWQELEVPYEAARVRTLIGLACRRLGDEDTARMEFDAAHWAFRQLGAKPDDAHVETLLRKGQPQPPGGLTRRELEVLQLVAAGKSNRAIADELFLSEKTVARHISNIFTKLDLTSRAAATAYAYKHTLLPPT
jgi:DNA-binding CsgD family transcriptional regulator